MIIDRLCQEVEEYGPVCVGLDTRLDYLPPYLDKTELDTSEKLFKFNREIIEATLAHVACYKVQIACYEALGLAGLTAYARTLEYIRRKGKIVIADIKRGDISATAELYARGHFTGDFAADFITVNPYMGRDAVFPYFKYLQSGDKGIFVLIRTSNQGSADLQDLKVDDRPIYLYTAEKVEEWGRDFRGQLGYSLIGGVVGLTYAEEARTINGFCQHTFYLIPGYGAQGGTGQDLVGLLRNENGVPRAVVNSSRAIITAHQGVDESPNFAEQARLQVLKMKEDILKWLE